MVLKSRKSLNSVPSNEDFLGEVFQGLAGNEMKKFVEKYPFECNLIIRKIHKKKSQIKKPVDSQSIIITMIMVSLSNEFSNMITNDLCEILIVPYKMLPGPAKCYFYLSTNILRFYDHRRGNDILAKIIDTFPSGILSAAFDRIKPKCDSEYYTFFNRPGFILSEYLFNKLLGYLEWVVLRDERFGIIPWKEYGILIEAASNNYKFMNSVLKSYPISISRCNINSWFINFFWNFFQKFVEKNNSIGTKCMMIKFSDYLIRIKGVPFIHDDFQYQNQIQKLNHEIIWHNRLKVLGEHQGKIKREYARTIISYSKIFSLGMLKPVDETKYCLVVKFIGIIGLSLSRNYQSVAEMIIEVFLNQTFGYRSNNSFSELYLKF